MYGGKSFFKVEDGKAFVDELVRFFEGLLPDKRIIYHEEQDRIYGVLDRSIWIRGTGIRISIYDYEYEFLEFIKAEHDADVNIHLWVNVVGTMYDVSSGYITKMNNWILSASDTDLVILQEGGQLNCKRVKGKLYYGEKMDYIRIGRDYAADVMAYVGYDVEMLRELDGGNGYGIKENANPDHLIEQRAFDVCTPKEGAKPIGIKWEIAEKIKENADRIILVLKYYKRDADTLREYLLGQVGRDGDLYHLRELKAIVSGRVEDWFVR